MQSVISKCLFLLLFVPGLLIAQASYDDAVYWKDGGIIKGRLVEMPGAVVRLQTSDGQVLIFKMQTVERVHIADPKQMPKPGEIPSSREGLVAIMAGVSFPSGDLAATDGQNAGFARMGFTVAVQYATISKNSFFFGAGVTYSSNPLNEERLKEALHSGSQISSSPWTSFVPYLAIGFAQPSGPLRPFIAGVAGLEFSSSPQVVLGPSTQPSSSTNTVCYGGMAGFITSSRLQIIIRYLVSTPKYEIGSSGSGMEFEQSSNLFQVLVGFSL